MIGPVALEDRQEREALPRLKALLHDRPILLLAVTFAGSHVTRASAMPACGPGP